MGGAALAERLGDGLRWRGVVVACSAGIAALVLWAALTRVEIVVMAPATLRPATPVAVLRAQASQTLAAVAVQVGDRVSAGQLVARLAARGSEAAWRASRAALAARVRERNEEQALLRWLDAGAPSVPEPGASVLGRARMAAHLGRVEGLRAEVRITESRLRAAGAEAEAAARMLDVSAARRDALMTAHRRGAVSRFDLLQARRAHLADRGELDLAQSRLLTLREQLDGQREAVDQVTVELRAHLHGAIAAARVEIADLRRRHAVAEEQRLAGRIVSPIDGVIDRLDAATGAFLRAGDPVAVVVPDAAELIVEARVPPARAAFIRTGQPCRVKLDALPFPRYGTLPCNVESLALDVREPESASAHYLARLRPARQFLWADGAAITLRPGATGWVDLVAGSRSVLSFVTEPVRRFSRETLRER